MNELSRACTREGTRCCRIARLTVCYLALVACSSSATPGQDAGAGGAGPPHPDSQATETITGQDDGGEDVTTTGAAPEVPATNISCNQIRICAAICTSTACVDACVNRGTTAARALFADWASCVNPICNDVGDTSCRCEASCFGGSACESQTCACAGDEVDYVCDELCH